MNWVDLLILAAIALGLYTGYRRGVVLQVFSWGGFLLGIIVGGIVGPPLVRAIGVEGRAKPFVALACFLGVAFLIEGVIAFGGFKLARKITHGAVRKADAVVGAVVAAVMSIVIAWLLSAPAGQVPAIAKAVKRSAIIGTLYDAFSRPPDFLATIGKLLSRTGFPEVFAGINPSLAPGVDRPPARLARDPEIMRAARLTYKIESRGCGGVVDGSGFPYDGDTVITAAHVVAGTSDTKVIPATDNGDGPFDATVVYMDTDTDIAVLYVPGLTRGRLEVSDAVAGRGTDGAAIGYPGGGDRTTSPARVRMRTEATGYDIYSDDRVERDIYVLRAVVRQGNSGGPFVDTEGIVRGLIFAASASEEEEAYALAETEILAAVERAGDRHRGVDTGECAI